MYLTRKPNANLGRAYLFRRHDGTRRSIHDRHVLLVGHLTGVFAATTTATTTTPAAAAKVRLVRLLVGRSHRFLVNDLSTIHTRTATTATIRYSCCTIRYSCCSIQ